MSRRFTRTFQGVAVLTGAALAVTGALAAPSSAAPAVQPVARGLLSPLSVSASPDGTLVYSENFKGTLLRRGPHGKRTTLFQARKPGREIGAVSQRRGSVRFAESFENRYAVLYGIGDDGKPVRLADLMAHERRANPDRGVSYGFSGLDADCAEQFPEGFPVSYRGVVESHPYATYLDRSGTTFVADAAGNAVTAVGPRGKVRTVAVIPPAPLAISAGFAEANGLPECAVGETYRFESVPTDVERGPDGNLYVTTLPGGPEDGSLGAAASVYRVNPTSGAVRKVAGGLSSATGLAVAANGDLFVAELFRSRIVKIPAGTSTPRPFLDVVLPGDVEIQRGQLYATTHVLTGLSGEPGDAPAGRVVRIDR